MKSFLIALLIFASTTIQLSYAAPYHRSAARSYHHQLGRHLQNPQDQDNWLGGTGNWSNGGDWSLNAPPGSGDDATIGGANDYVSFDVGTTTINSLTLSGTLTDKGVASQLNLNSSLTVNSSGVLDFSAGRIWMAQYSGDVSNYGKMYGAVILGTYGGSFGNGGLFVGSVGGSVFGGGVGNSGVMITPVGGGIGGIYGIANDGLWDNFGGVSFPQGRYGGGSLVNSGTFNNHTSGGISLTYQVQFQNYGTFTNDGTLYIDAVRGGGSFGNAVGGVVTNNGTITSYGWFSNDGTFVNNGTWTGEGGNDGSIVNNGTFATFATLGSGFGNTGSYVQNGSQSATYVDSIFSTTTPLQINGGLLSGNGTIQGDVNMSGILHPCYGPGGCNPPTCRLLTIQGNYQQFGIGTLETELAGTQAGVTYDQLAVTGNAALDGTLDVEIRGGYAWPIGTTFFPLTYGTRNGTFSTIDLPALPPGEAWDYAYEATDFKLWIDSVPEPTSLALVGGGLLSMVGLLRRRGH
jgi:hypothetical protein